MLIIQAYNTASKMRKNLYYSKYYVTTNMAGILLLLLSLSLLITYHQTMGNLVHSNQAHIGHRIDSHTFVATVTPNNPIAEFHLYANHAAGYQWNIAPQSVQCCAHHMKPTMYQPDVGARHIIGSNDKEIWRFRVLPNTIKAGKTITIHMIYGHPWTLSMHDHNLSMQSNQVLLPSMTHQLIIHIAQS